MKRSHRILLVLVLTGTIEFILGACVRILNLAGANLIMTIGLLSQISALGYAGYLSLKKSRVAVR
ncbi:MAG: hypothetical protein EP346_02480 [Bacteroidetes bacterium]|uniref:hypothetical protein n=1 Tax=Phaeocystidibacter marisrubri TaxID=1577780 RepID=UPI001478FF43|nr:hypothetical protein [Phaeocystidibacter marisrubri]TNE30857.1 MAG: hypothetical protein EP346_02480 [Bacteroidota bacterium]